MSKNEKRIKRRGTREKATRVEVRRGKQRRVEKGERR